MVVGKFSIHVVNRCFSNVSFIFTIRSFGVWEHGSSIFHSTRFVLRLKMRSHHCISGFGLRRGFLTEIQGSESQLFGLLSWQKFARSSFELSTEIQSDTGFYLDGLEWCSYGFLRDSPDAYFLLIKLSTLPGEMLVLICSDGELSQVR